MTNSEAIKFDTVSYMDVLTKDLKVMDSTAISLAKENDIPIVVFSVKSEGNFAKILCGQGSFTVVKNDK